MDEDGRDTTPSQPPAVAYILKMFPRFSETFILAEILELERSGLPVRIFSLKRPNDSRVHADVARVRAKVSYVPVTGLSDAWALLGSHLTVFRWDPGRYVKVAISTIKRRRWGAVKRFLQASAIAPDLKAEGIGHVHAHFASSATSVAYYLHQLMDMSYSFTAHAKDIYIDSVAEDVLTRKMRDARFVVTVSDFNVQRLSSLAPDASITRIYNGLDLQQFRLNGTKPDPVPLVLAVGRLVEKKGFDDLIRACAILRDRNVRFRCSIVGDGEQRATLQTLVDELDLQGAVELAGPLPREELIERYPRASVVVAPCVVGADGNRDGLPTVLIEAMALQTPVISTPVTGIPELVRHEETGQLVAPHDPAGLATVIERSLGQREQLTAMAEAGRLLVEQEFDIRRNVGHLRQLFEMASETA